VPEFKIQAKAPLPEQEADYRRGFLLTFAFSLRGSGNEKREGRNLGFASFHWTKYWMLMRKHYYLNSKEENVARTQIQEKVRLPVLP
jgi:hypothetical protein